MSTVFIRQRVADYPTWRRHFDADDPLRQEYGLSVRKVQHAPEDPNDLVLELEAHNLARAKLFLCSERTRQAREFAGVQGRPEVWFGVDP